MQLELKIICLEQNIGFVKLICVRVCFNVCVFVYANNF